MKHNMEQSFWFEGLQFDKTDFPIEKPVYIDNINHQSSIFTAYNIFDIVYGYNRYIKLSELFAANTEQKWCDLKKKINLCQSITIIDDISASNKEVSFIKKFYLESFYSALKSVNHNCYVLQNTEN